MTIIEKKKALRNDMLIARAKLLKEYKAEYDKWICDALWDTIVTNGYKTIHCYLPMGKEINITPLIAKLLDHSIKVVSPKTLPKRKLKNLVLHSLIDIEKGVYGTSHPAGNSVYEGDFDLVIIPGLAFDDKNYRLGYGGGYYDNFLVTHPEAKKIGIFYPFQKVDVIPLEPHDLQLDEILVNFEIPQSTV